MPTPTIPAGNLYMNATLYTGTGAAQSITNGNPGQSFQPDFVWIKSRSSAYDHNVFDSVRGVYKQLVPNATYAENNYTTSLTAFNSNGFSVGSDIGTNNSGSTFVGWQWKAGGTAVSNTSGSITSSVSANTTSGFSVVTYTGTGANATVGHGLGAVPSMYIVKKRSASGDNWCTYHISLGNTKFIRLDTNNVVTTFNLWQDTTPTSSVFYLSSDVGTNGSGSTFVAYCWTPIAGYSAFGSYTGNGSSDGPFVFTGFRPEFILTKCSTATGTNWNIKDATREPNNVSTQYLVPNSSAAEGSGSTWSMDILSNGFKMRTADSLLNTNGETYIYMAFAENPFKFANAR